MTAFHSSPPDVADEDAVTEIASRISSAATALPRPDRKI